MLTIIAQSRSWNEETETQRVFCDSEEPVEGSIQAGLDPCDRLLFVGIIRVRVRLRVRNLYRACIIGVVIVSRVLALRRNVKGDPYI